MDTNPIRVLQVVTNMDMGGLENRIMDIYRNIDKDKVQFDFLVHRNQEGYFDNEIKQLGGNIYRLPPITPITLIWKYKKEAKNFFSEHNDYKIIHAHNNALSMLTLKAAKKVCSPVCIAHSRTSSLKKELKSIIKFVCKLRIKKYSDYYFACSKDAGRWLFGKKCVESGSFKIINNAIDSKKYIYNEQIRDRVRKSLKINDNELVIGHVGSMRFEKNHKFIIKIFNEVIKKNSKAVLLLIGDGELKGEIIKELTKYKIIENVRIIGISDEVNKYMQAMDVFIFPSHFEGFGTVAVEAQASGLPVIASEGVPKSTKITDLIQYLSLDDDISIWVEKILSINNRNRKNMYDSIRNSGFDIYSVSKEIEQIYINMIER